MQNTLFPPLRSGKTLPVQRAMLYAAENPSDLGDDTRLAGSAALVVVAVLVVACAAVLLLWSVALAV